MDQVRLWNLDKQTDATSGRERFGHLREQHDELLRRLQDQCEANDWLWSSAVALVWEHNRQMEMMVRAFDRRLLQQDVSEEITERI